MNKDKINNVKSILSGLESTAEENTSVAIDDEIKSNKSEFIRLQEENRKLREAIVGLAIELYSRKN